VIREKGHFPNLKPLVWLPRPGVEGWERKSWEWGGLMQRGQRTLFSFWLPVQFSDRPHVSLLFFDSFVLLSFQRSFFPPRNDGKQTEDHKKKKKKKKRLPLGVVDAPFSVLGQLKNHGQCQMVKVRS
jgi:hypothetical protein